MTPLVLFLVWTHVRRIMGLMGNAAPKEIHITMHITTLHGCLHYLTRTGEINCQTSWMILQTSYLTATAPPPAVSLLYLRAAQASGDVFQELRCLPNHRVTHKKLSLSSDLAALQRHVSIEFPAVSELSIAGLPHCTLMAPRIRLLGSETRRLGLL